MWGSGTPESPDYWLVWIPPAAASDADRNRSLCVLAPQFVRRQLFDGNVEMVFKVTDAASFDSGHRVLFFSEANQWLRATGRDWADAGVDWESALEQLDRAVVIEFKADDITYAVAAGAATVLFEDGPVDVDDEQRAAVRARVQKWLEDEWPRAIGR